MSLLVEDYLRITIGNFVNLSDAIKQAIDCAKERHPLIVFNFNGIDIYVFEDAVLERVVRDYHTALRIMGYQRIGPHYTEEYSDHYKILIEKTAARKEIDDKMEKIVRLTKEVKDDIVKFGKKFM